MGQTPSPTPNPTAAHVAASTQTVTEQRRGNSTALPTQCKGVCWEARPSKHPFCVGYDYDGYTCFGDHCAACDPRGNPRTCARRQPVGTTPNALGKCVPVTWTDTTFPLVEMPAAS